MYAASVSAKATSEEVSIVVTIRLTELQGND